MDQFYSNSDFDRSFHLRHIPHLAGGKDILFLMRDNRFLYKKTDSSFELKYFPYEAWSHISDKIYFLGVKDGKNVWCMDLTVHNTTGAALNAEEGEFLNVRKIVSRLDKHSASLSAYARGLVNWNRFQLYCSLCGYGTESQQYGHSRKCLNPTCNQVFYPQIAPAVIVLIEHTTSNGDVMCLLNRRKTDHGYSCSTLAGFVEVGESLEDAVMREMKEEVNVEVKNIRYAASQAWPFSSSLMIGFIAETETTSFQPDGEEIKDAGWYSAMEIRKKVLNNKLILSKEDSIARYLIEHWVQQQRK